MRELEGEWIIKKEMRIISKDGTISEFPGYTSSKEEEKRMKERRKKRKRKSILIGSMIGQDYFIQHLSSILKAGILTDEAVCCGIMTRNSEKRKEAEETVTRRCHLFKNKAKIVCHEKVVRIPFKSGEILRVQGKRTLGGMKTLMSTKAEELELSDIPILRDFIDVFLEDLLRLPPQ
ncbi:hypothetical protein Tco_1354857 [Tanacetum coccineum]